jgi:LPXTG-motif cell wall-anchored protein
VFEAASPAATPLPGALPLMAAGLGALGLLGWRRKKKPALAA